MVSACLMWMAYSADSGAPQQLHLQIHSSLGCWSSLCGDYLPHYAHPLPINLHCKALQLWPAFSYITQQVFVQCAIGLAGEGLLSGIDPSFDNCRLLCQSEGMFSNQLAAIPSLLEELFSMPQRSTQLDAQQ